jgi:acyl dehydratase
MSLDLSLVGKPSAPVEFSYTWKDVALYALGIGAGRDELDYLYEGLGPRVIPSFAVVPMFEPMVERLRKTGGDLSQIVHGAQRVQVHGPFAPSGRIVSTATIRGMYDLRRLAVVVVDVQGVDDGGRVVFDATSNIIFRGDGGWGGETPPKEKKVAEIPKGKPADFRVEQVTSLEQALLYRLSGDLNPLHADPAFAKSVGFEAGPILHGLCSLGFMTRHVARAVAAGDATRLSCVECKFVKPVWPGDTLVTEGWLVGPGLYATSVSVKERSEVVVSGACAIAHGAA